VRQPPNAANADDGAGADTVARRGANGATTAVEADDGAAADADCGTVTASAIRTARRPRPMEKAAHKNAR